MSLVPNYGSSDSESSDTEAAPSVSKSSLASILPPPKKANQEQKKAVFYVNLPSGADSDDEEDRLPKRPKINSTGNDLASLLPPPKNTLKRPAPVLSNAASTSKPTLVPPSVSRQIKTTTTTTSTTKKKEISAATAYSSNKPNSEVQHQDQDESESDEEDSFEEDTSLASQDISTRDSPQSSTAASEIHTSQVVNSGEPRTQAPAVDPHTQSSYDPNAIYSYDPNAMYTYGSDPSMYQQYFYQNQETVEQDSNTDSQSNTVGDLDDAMLNRLAGKRGRGQETNIQIKSVNQADILPSDEWREQVKNLTAPKFVSSAQMIQASGLQKKKNNIMALAAQAQSLQERLDEQYAANRRSKAESRNKYGF